MKLLIYPPIDAERLHSLGQVADGLQIVNAVDEEQAQSEMPTADAFFGKLTPELLERAHQLTWVQSPTASLEHFLFPELIEHPCRLSNMRGLFSDVIADHVMGFVLCFARNLHTYVRRQMDAVWEPVGGESSKLTAATGPSAVTAIDRGHRHLSDSTLGVIGVGSIGAEVCRRGAAFGMRVLGVDPVCLTVPEAVPEVWPTERLDDLLRESDYVVVAAPHTPETEHLISRRQFELMRETAVLINVGRGIIVDLQALTEALQAGAIGGAGLDVFEVEPLPAEHPLWAMENVMITPHIAAASPRIAERHMATLVENVRRFCRGEPPLTLVDKRRWF